MVIGGYEVLAIETGRFRLDGGAMFGVVPKPLWERIAPADERNRIAMASRSMLLRGNGRTILVDAGNGDKYSDKLRDIFAFDTTGNDIVTSLARYGVAPGDVTDVILTHLHFDHAGGATVRVRDRIEPAFPRARYHVQRAQWDAAHRPTERDRASYIPEDFEPLMEEGVLQLRDDDGEILPGITTLVCYGHTTALQCPVVSDGKTSLVFCADLVPMRPHVQLPWIMGYDLRPLVTLEEKRRVLRRAVDEGWLLFFQHDPDVAMSRAVEDEKGFRAGPVISI